MNVIAVHYPPGGGEALTAPLAEALDQTLYEVRARLSDPEGGPAVVARYGEIEPAWACAGRLRANNIAPILITREEVETDARRFLIRSFELGERGLSATSRRGESVEVPYGEIVLVLRGVRIDETTALKTTEQKKFSVGRAIMTQGLVMTKTVRKLERVTNSAREEFLHLYPGGAEGRPPLVFRAGALDYRSFGADLQPSVQANFTRLIAELRRRVPGARFDERLATSHGRARILGPGLREGHLDIAISLLARVLLKSRTA